MRSAGRSFAAGCAALVALAANATASEPAAPLFNDSHFHLTNYVQQGPDIATFLRLIGDRVGRVAILGIPLQQTWSHENSADFAPSYYLQTDAPLYDYSFTDACIASQFLSLAPKDRARFDPMITGFNPADMYGVDHIKRVLQTFPGVFSGIGEFSIHKEFVSSKVAGDTASLTDRALDRIFAFCAGSGLLVLIHNDVDMPFAQAGAEPVYLTQMKDLLRRHPKTTTIWAHLGLGRVVHPPQSQAAAGPAERVPNQAGIVESILLDAGLVHLYFDLSWSEVAKYLTATPAALETAARILNRYPERFLFGTDEVAPESVENYLRVYQQYEPLWQRPTPRARELVLKGNYERLFDEARGRVRAWERANPR
jgi:hypothetical protein